MRENRPEGAEEEESLRGISRRGVLKHGAAASAFVAGIGATTTAAQQGCDITVPDDFSTVQDAIDSADPGDTICVKGGTYAEDRIEVDVENLTLRATGNATIESSAGGGQTVVNLSASGVTVQGFTVRATDAGTTPFEFQLSAPGGTVINNDVPRQQNSGNTPSPGNPAILVNASGGTVRGNELTDAPIGGGDFDGAQVQANRFSGAVPDEGIWASNVAGIDVAIRGNNVNKLTTDANDGGAADIGLFDGVPDSVNGSSVDGAQEAATVLVCQNNVDTAAVDGTEVDRCQRRDRGSP